MPSNQQTIEKKRSLFSATSLVSLMTMISRVLGFVRDILIAQCFGASAGIDAFFVAFKIPNFMRRLFAEGAFSQAFVPVLAEYQTNKQQELNAFMAKIFGNLAVILTLITIVAVLASPWLIHMFAPGFEPSGFRYTLAVEMLRLTFPYLLLISLTAFHGAVLNTFGRFGVPAFTPVLLNVTLIMAAWYAPAISEVPVVALAWGVLVAGIVQFVFQLPFLYQAGLWTKPTMDWHDKGVKKVLKLMVPALFGVSVSQINLLLDTIFASFLKVGSVAWLYYSDRLTFFPLGVFGVAISTVILPYLSRQHASQSEEAYSQGIDWGIRLILLISIPSTVGLYLFAYPLLMTLFGYGKFTLYDVTMTSYSLKTFSIGLSGFMLIKLFGSAFYATQNIKTPVKVGAVAMLINTALCLALIGPMAHAGLALASSIAGLINAGTLLWLLIRLNVYQPGAGWPTFLLQIVFANVCMAILLSLGNDPAVWGKLSAVARASKLSLCVLQAIAVYTGALYLAGVRPAMLKAGGVDVYK